MAAAKVWLQSWWYQRELLDLRALAQVAALGTAATALPGTVMGAVMVGIAARYMPNGLNGLRLDRMRLPAAGAAG